MRANIPLLRIMKTLHLVLKRKWYDMIECGDKTEEYREIKSYWERRLFGGGGSDCKDCKNFPIDLPTDENYTRFKRYEKYSCHNCPIGLNFDKKFDIVNFHLGYTKEIISFKINDIIIGKGKSKWGAPIDRDVFIIKLGDRLK